MEDYLISQTNRKRERDREKDEVKVKNFKNGKMNCLMTSQPVMIRSTGTGAFNNGQ